LGCALTSALAFDGACGEYWAVAALVAFATFLEFAGSGIFGMTRFTVPPMAAIEMQGHDLLQTRCPDVARQKIALAVNQ